MDVTSTLQHGAPGRIPPGWGGESGESSGGSDDDADDNQEYKDTGVEDDPTLTIDGSDSPTGEPAPRLPPPVVCVCLDLRKKVATFTYAIPIARMAPSNTCDVITPPDSSHQPLPGEMLANGCPSGRRRWETLLRRFRGHLLASRLVRHSVTPRCISLLLAFLALSDFRRDVSRTVSVTIHNALRY